MRPSTLGKKSKKRRIEYSQRYRYRRGIRQITKQCYGNDVRMSTPAASLIENLVMSQIPTIIEQAHTFRKFDKKQTLKASHVSRAARLLLPKDLGKHALFEINKSLNKMNDAEEVPPVHT